MYYHQYDIEFKSENIETVLLTRGKKYSCMLPETSDHYVVEYFTRSCLIGTDSRPRAEGRKNPKA